MIALYITLLLYMYIDSQFQWLCEVQHTLYTCLQVFCTTVDNIPNPLGCMLLSTTICGNDIECYRLQGTGYRY